MTRWKGKLPDKITPRVINPDGHALAEHTKKSKYGSKKTEVDGIVFDSKREANFYQELLMLKRAGEVINIERQVKYPYFATYSRDDGIVTFTKPGFYKADFVVTYKDGHKDVVDIKGFATAIYRKKKKIIEKLYGIEIIEK